MRRAGRVDIGLKRTIFTPTFPPNPLRPCAFAPLRQILQQRGQLRRQALDVRARISL